MGHLEQGRWRRDDEPFGKRENGAFVRADSSIRNWVRRDGSTPFRPEAGRYHLYVSYACPWAHRTLLARRLKGLTRAISVSVVLPVLGEDGWELRSGPGSATDALPNVRHLYEIYVRSDDTYTGRVTVPVLWDRNTQSIVSNESSDIMRMFNDEFAAVARSGVDLCPPEFRERIDALNDFVYDRINNGVYRCGFAATQEAYETAFARLFEGLEFVERTLSESRYLTGDACTEADWRLFPTLVRFDPVYALHFKCNKRRMSDYPNLFGYLRELYQWPGVAETVNFEHIKEHYYRSHPHLNPGGIVPAGPDLSYLRWPHVRDQFRHVAPG